MPVTRERHGPWALLVGGSEGIGEELASQLAAIGINLVLVARKPEALAATAAKARATGVEVRTLSYDASAEDLVDRIRELTDDVEVGLLVHNVGGGGGGRFFDRSLDDVLRSSMVNCVNFTKLVHHYGKPMVTRGAGGVLTFGSMAGNVGGAYMTSYSGGKAYVQLFCEALWAELDGTGVDVLAIVIGSADTPARQRSGTKDVDLFPVARPEDVAKQALREIGNGPVQVPAGSEKAFAAFNIPDRREAVDTIRRLLAQMSAA
ncbi:MAG: SDR family NAD(P)-dependent oxidoreductase [Sphingomonadales bacterium]|nr:SDR family NAD(P)-dependent oxidoreductase [Sphingomonadales bacterium]